MDLEYEEKLVTQIRQYVTENLPLSKMSDEELEDKIEALVIRQIGNNYCSIEQRVSIVRQIYNIC